MEWSVVKLEKEVSKSIYSAPCASVGNGRLRLNSGACKLIKNYDQYSYVEFLQGKKNGGNCIGVRFLLEEQKTVNSLPIKKYSPSKTTGHTTAGININNKRVLEKLFGHSASAKTVEKFNVELDEDDKTILVIYKD